MSKKRKRTVEDVLAEIPADERARMEARWSLTDEEFEKHVTLVQKRTRRAMDRAADALIERTRCTYFVREKDGDYLKIGWTDRPLERRLAELQAGNPRELSLERVVKLRTAREAKQLEGALHRYFADRRIRGEWFEIEPAELVAALELFVEEV